MDEDKERETEAQLDLWGAEIDRRAAEIDRRAAEVATPDREVGFAVRQHLDELKVLHAMARARFAALTAGDAGEQADLEKDFADAWNELAAAIGRPLPR